ncbi:hypothetical protein OKW27_001248 [Paraburkholderia sp. 35.1]
MREMALRDNVVCKLSGGLCQLIETEAERRQEKRPSELVGRILGDFGEFGPGNESRRELFAIE